MLKKVIRARYTSEFKQEAVRMAEAKGSIAEVAHAASMCSSRRCPTGSVPHVKTVCCRHWAHRER